MKIVETNLTGAVIESKSVHYVDGVANAYVVCIVDHDDTPTLVPQNYKFLQTGDLTEAGVAVHPYGALIVPADVTATGLAVEVLFDGDYYEADLGDILDADVGDAITFTPVDD
jgi:hypothetical protein